MADGPGAMLAAVTADLAALDIESIPGGRTYAATALWLARVIDKRGEDDGPSVTAKLAKELNDAMARLTRKGSDGPQATFDDLTASLSVPQ